MEHRQPGGDVAQRDREIQVLSRPLHRGQAVAQHQPVVVDVPNLLRRVLWPSVEQHGAQPHLQRLLGHTCCAVSRTGRGECRQREDQGTAGSGQRGDRARVGHPGAGY